MHFHHRAVALREGLHVAFGGSKRDVLQQHSPLMRFLRRVPLIPVVFPVRVRAHFRLQKRHVIEAGIKRSLLLFPLQHLLQPLLLLAGGLRVGLVPLPGLGLLGAFQLCGLLLDAFLKSAGALGVLAPPPGDLLAADLARKIHLDLVGHDVGIMHPLPGPRRRVLRSVPQKRKPPRHAVLCRRNLHIRQVPVLAESPPQNLGGRGAAQVLHDDA
mmetsp:Transcript_75752/g.202700  ORF Transcript_75752/g.202700 Transcript_75752/m.202700 type:complete len:214 (-) Transcript_75752:107-748(-)